ncbi:MAG: hypothetical protein CMH83_23580 [Nocardioides sp.]|nr:hypothetical protein [Nocardioides sp.]
MTAPYAGLVDTTFASRSVAVHLVRGALGIPLVVAAFALLPVVAPWPLLLLVPGVALLRGCPTCWALGLVQTRAVCAMKAPADAAQEQPVAHRVA